MFEGISFYFELEYSLTIAGVRDAATVRVSLLCCFPLLRGELTLVVQGRADRPPPNTSSHHHRRYPAGPPPKARATGAASPSAGGHDHVWTRGALWRVCGRVGAVWAQRGRAALRLGGGV